MSQHFVVDGNKGNASSCGDMLPDLLSFSFYFARSLLLPNMSTCCEPINQYFVTSCADQHVSLFFEVPVLYCMQYTARMVSSISSVECYFHTTANFIMHSLHRSVVYCKQVASKPAKKAEECWFKISPMCGLPSNLLRGKHTVSTFDENQ